MLFLRCRLAFLAFLGSAIGSISVSPVSFLDGLCYYSLAVLVISGHEADVRNLWLADTA